MSTFLLNFPDLFKFIPPWINNVWVVWAAPFTAKCLVSEWVVQRSMYNGTGRGAVISHDRAPRLPRACRKSDVQFLPVPDSKQNKPPLAIVYGTAGQNIHATLRLTQFPICAQNSLQLFFNHQFLLSTRYSILTLFVFFKV